MIIKQKNRARKLNAKTAKAKLRYTSQNKKALEKLENKTKASSNKKIEKQHRRKKESEMKN